MTLEYKIATMQAQLDDEEIEMKVKGLPDWFPVKVPAWDWVHANYRVRIEAAAYALVDRDGVVVQLFKSKAEAEALEWVSRHVSDGLTLTKLTGTIGDDS